MRANRIEQIATLSKLSERADRAREKNARTRLLRGLVFSSRAPFHRVRPCPGVTSTTTAMITSPWTNAAPRRFFFPLLSIYLLGFLSPFPRHPGLSSLCRVNPLFPASRFTSWIPFGWLVSPPGLVPLFPFLFSVYLAVAWISQVVQFRIHVCTYRTKLSAT